MKPDRYKCYNKKAYLRLKFWKQEAEIEPEGVGSPEALHYVLLYFPVAPPLMYRQLGCWIDGWGWKEGGTSKCFVHVIGLQGELKINEMSGTGEGSCVHHAGYIVRTVSFCVYVDFI